jgi:PPOX class probable FMN-dependent enzyme
MPLLLFCPIFHDLSKENFMSIPPFTQVIRSEEELRALIGEPSELVLRKQLAALDAHCQAFIALAPFVLLGTTGHNGLCDVSPRGDAPGFVQVLNPTTLLIPDRPGNRRVDSLRNIMQTGAVGLLLMIPGVEETLRVNGRAWLVRDEALLTSMAVHGKAPLLAIGVHVEECFLQCAKALRRSQLWQPSTWPDRVALPSLAQMLLDQVQMPGTTLAELEAGIAESYAKRLY